MAIPESEYLNYAYPTNAAGTATTTIESQSGSTVLAYPTEFIDYPAGYPVSGTFNSSGKCYTNPSITWRPQDLTSLTQPVASTPSGGDKFGTLYTIAGTLGAWPSGWLQSRLKDTLPSACDLASFAPASAVQGALLLTTTSISTRSGSSSASPSSTSKPTSTPKETTPLAVQNSSKSSTPKTSAPISPTTAVVAPPVVIGSTTVPISAILPSQTGTSAQSVTSPQAVVIGSQTVVVGNTVTVGGMTVIVTTGSDALPQIVYGTTTVMVAPATTSADSGSGSGVGSYIMSGLSGPATSSDSGSSAGSSTRIPNLQSSAAAGTVSNGLPADGIWYTLIMALLSFF